MGGFRERLEMQAGTANFDRTLPGLSILAARGMFYLIVLMLAVALLWASITRVNVVVSAEGRLAPRAESAPFRATSRAHAAAARLL
jgi:hypothetical protein